MAVRPKISAVILAGGQGSRMGGVDKGWVEFRGRPLILHALEAIRSQVDEVLISANRSLDAYRRLGFPVLSDDMPDYPGPLAGIRQALKAASHELLLCVPCDTPFLPPDLAERLSQALERGDGDIAVAEADGEAQPVIFLCRKSVLPGLEAFMDQGGRGVGRWQAGLKRVGVAFDAGV
ncbi:MAG: molybdenum cofactor guanylyltransferase MobA, partial [Sulfuricellaceae bacterium]